MQWDIRETYLQFVEERHRVWARRQLGLPAPWSTDPVLQGHRFTNVFRVLDDGSQYLVRELLYSDEPSYADALMRCFLYRYTNRPEPWEHFYAVHGRHPTVTDLGRVLPQTWMAYDQPIFSAAFKIFCGQENKGADRLTWVLGMTRHYFHPDSPAYVVPAFQACTTMEDRIAVLRTIPRCAAFMSMQIVTDMGYSAHLAADEDEYVVAGPGAVRGAAALGLDPLVAISWGWGQARKRPGWPKLATPSGERIPSLMDVQNTLCEFSKYVRYASAPTVRTYQPRHPGPQPEPFIPPHW